MPSGGHHSKDSATKGQDIVIIITSLALGNQPYLCRSRQFLPHPIVNRFFTAHFTPQGIVLLRSWRETQGMRWLPEFPKGHLYLLLAPHAIQRPLLNEFVARLALRGEVQVLMCGNRFEIHAIARRLRRSTEALEPALERIHLARAFTCYQVLALLRQHRATDRSTIATDLPDLFFDESLPQTERLKRFRDCLSELKRLSRNVQTLVSAAPVLHPAQQPFLVLLQAAAETIWELELLPRSSLQPRLF